MFYLGAMTGTSVDGLDIALLRARARLEIVAAATVPLPAELTASLRALAEPGENEVVRAALADAWLGEFIGQSALERLAEWNVRPAQVRAIGSHGQTIRHHPEAERPFTVQIGDPNRIAEIAGIDVVADFRRRDVAAGGEGAPLAPLFHAALFRHEARPRVALNIGGIANVTMLPPAVATMRGFDTGPGNALLDAWSLARRGLPFDEEGAWGASGRVAGELLARLQSDPFVRRAPPKSTGKEAYHLGFIDRARQGLDLAPEDVQATLAEFTAWSVAESIARWGPGEGDVIACGGGRRNALLMRRLAERLPGHRLLTADDLGVDGDAVEAAAFAWFAWRALEGRPGNAPSVTGARGQRVLGAIYPAGEARSGG